MTFLPWGQEETSYFRTEINSGKVEKDPLPMYTVKITPCGYPGRYMRATDNYLKRHNHPDVVKKRGPFDKVFVREFAKLSRVLTKSVGMSHSGHQFQNSHNRGTGLCHM